MAEVSYWYSMSWYDELRRMWVYPPSSFENPSEARKAHTLSMRGHWVKQEMFDPHVSDLFVNNGSRSTSIAEGGDITRPPVDKPLPYKE